MFSKSAMGVSTGPDILLYKRFQKSWKQIQKETYETDATIMPWKEEVLTFCKHKLKECHPRADYRELLELTIIYLGGTPREGFSFKHPGAVHRARWMAKIIYAIKLVLFRSQFKMTKQELSAMERFSRFAVHYYVPNWFAAPIACSAPTKDLQYLQQLKNCEDTELASVASNALCRHLWYLSEELVSLAFMDDEVPLEIKRTMVEALKKPSSESPEKRCTLDTTANMQNKTLADFVTESSRLFFTKLSLDSSFLEVDPVEWNERNDYRKAKNFV
jgi:hypothetical protein